jgi:small GTP-binding protein
LQHSNHKIQNLSNASFSCKLRPIIDSTITNFKGALMIKVILVGATGSGKTTLLKKMGGQAFSPDYAPTLGAEFKMLSKEEDGLRLALQCWDLCGDPKFDKMMQNFASRSHAILFCIDLSKPWDKENIRERIQHLRQIAELDAPIFLVGTKNDIAEKTISEEELTAFAQELRCEALITSAQSGEKVEELLRRLYQMDKVGQMPRPLITLLTSPFDRPPVLSPLEEALADLKDAVNTIPKPQRPKINKKIQALERCLMGSGTAQEKLSAIEDFDLFCRANTNQSRFHHAACTFCWAAAVTLLAATIGFCIGFALGCWTGPGAFFTGLAAGTTAASVVAGVSGGIGTFIGLRAFSLYRPAPLKGAITKLHEEASKLQEGPPSVPVDSETSHLPTATSPVV